MIITSSTGLNFVKESTMPTFYDGSLSGYVNDTSMNPIEGARVRVYFHGIYEEDYSDFSGYYHVSNIPICNCTKNCTASKAGYNTEWVLLGISENTTYDFVLTPGKTLYVGGDGPGNYSKIQDAIDDAGDFDTIFVFDYSSPYYEHVKIDKRINLVGEDRNTTVIDGDSSGDVVYVTADWVNISGFTIRNGDDGILIRSNHNTVSDNIISNNSDGINYCSSSNNTITGNTITSNNWDGIVGGGKNNIIIGNNISLNNKDGIFCWYGTNNNLLNNTISMNNGHGISFGQEGIEFHLSVTYSTISGNAISYNSGSGIYLIGSSHNSIFDNYVLDNKYGLNFEVAYGIPGLPSGIAVSSSNIIYQNNVTNNDYGIWFDFLCANNRICYNIFKENTKNAWCGGFNIWYNPLTRKGNYWDDYNGWDILPRWGIGDTPHNVPPRLILNKDRFPFMEPDDIENVEVEEYVNGVVNEINLDVVQQQSNSYQSSQQSSNMWFLQWLERFPILQMILDVLRLNI